MSIPRIIHQTWKSRRVPPALAAYVATWRRHHPDWEYRLWTDRANRQFIAAHYPEFLPTFDAYPYPIQRADAVRYFLLHRFGGLYVDLDFLCLRPVDDLLAGATCVLGLEPREHCLELGREQIVGNAIMAVAPGHPLFSAVIEQLPRYAERIDRVHAVLETTGPFMLSNVYAEFADREAVTLLPSSYFYPLSKAQGDEFRRTGQSPAPLDAAYGVHLHLGTWWRRDPLEKVTVRSLVRRLFRGPRRKLRTMAAGAMGVAGFMTWLRS